MYVYVLCVCMCMHVWMYGCVCVCECMWCMCMYICIRIYVWMYGCVCVCVNVCGACVCIYVYVCMYVSYKQLYVPLGASKGETKEEEKSSINYSAVECVLYIFHCLANKAPSVVGVCVYVCTQSYSFFILLTNLYPVTNPTP